MTILYLLFCTLHLQTDSFEVREQTTFPTDRVFSLWLCIWPRARAMKHGCLFAAYLMSCRLNRMKCVCLSWMWSLMMCPCVPMFFAFFKFFDGGPPRLGSVSKNVDKRQRTMRVLLCHMCESVSQWSSQESHPIPKADHHQRCSWLLHSNYHHCAIQNSKMEIMCPRRVQRVSLMERSKVRAAKPSLLQLSV